MPRDQSITSQSLAALGAEALADLLVEHAAADPALRKKLGMLLAGAKGAGKLGDEIDRRLRTIARSRSFLDSQKGKALTKELDHLRTTIATRLAQSDRGRALDLLWSLIDMAHDVCGRYDDGGGAAEDVFVAAMADLGRLAAIDPPGDRRALGRRVLACVERDLLGVRDRLIESMSDALGAEGRAEIRAATQAALDAAPKPDAGRDWSVRSVRLRLARRLAMLAVLDRDADAYMAAVRAGDMEMTHRIEIAERLLEFGRPAQVLDWLDKPHPSSRGHLHDDEETDLRIASLEALGRRDEAQALRWRHFESVLSVEHLRAYLRQLPDFEDFDAEQRAIAIAQAHGEAVCGLAFLVAWPALDRADRLVRERSTELDGRHYEILRPAAEALEARYPDAASLLYRRMVESVLDRGSSKQYPYAARDLLDCARLAPRLSQAGSIESHEAFLARLRDAHGRKYGFWGLF